MAGKSANPVRERLIDALGALSALGLVYFFGMFLYLRTLLTPAMPDLPEPIEILAALTVPAFAAAGLYHLVLLARAFQDLSRMPDGRFLHSVYLTVIVLSGLILATEPVQLTEIGKEYLLFDVGGQWLFLLAATLVHLAVVFAGLRYSRRVSGILPGVESRSDAFFTTMHQVGILCGLLGIVGVLSYSHWGVLEHYRPFMVLVLGGVALLPWIVILAFLVVRNRTKPPSAWFDEKQTVDTAVGALCSMLVAMPLLVVLGALDWYIKFAQPLSFWLMLVFFLCLSLFSWSVLIRNGGGGLADGAPGAA